MAGKRVRAIDRDPAVRAITGGVEACTYCRPDTDWAYVSRGRAG